MKTSITFEIDTDQLQSWTDEHIADLWHIAQANPADIDDREAGALAEYIGREIIRRWLKDCPPPLWNHQGRHFYCQILTRQGRYVGPDNKTWVPNDASPKEDGQ